MITLSINDSILKINTNLQDIHKITYFIFRYGKLINKFISDKNIIEFPLITFGIYNVKINYISEDKIHKTEFSYPIAFITDEIKANFNNELLIHKQNNHPKNELPLYIQPYPFLTNAVVVDKAKKISNITFDKFTTKKLDQKQQSIFLLSSGHIISSPDINKNIVSAGIIIHDNKLIFGVNEIERINTNCLGDTGIFSLFEISDQTLTAFSDYLGMQRIYYYNDDDLFICSNNYHFLLLIMKKIGLLPLINYDIIIANLCSNFYLFSQQQFGENMIFQNVKVLAVHEYLKVSNGELHILKSPLYDDTTNYIHNNHKITFEEALEEIKEQLTSIYNSPHFNSYNVDITGGLDSRMVLATITNIPDLFDKCTCRTLAINNDLDISLQITNTFNIPYSTAFSYNPPIDKIHSEKRSYFLGNYNKKFFVPFEFTYCDSSKEKRICFSGGCGEIVSRIYLSKTLSFSEIPPQDTVKFCQEAIKQIACTPISFIADSNTGVTIIENILVNEMNKMFGDTNYSKFDNMYLCYRNNQHFNQFHFEYDGLTWFPLNAKKTFLMGNYLKFIYKNQQHAMDFIAYCNQILSLIPYSDEKYNILQNKLKTNSNMRRVNLTFKSDKTNYNKSAEIKKQTKDSLNYTDKIENYSNLNKYYYEECLHYLNNLFNLNPPKLKDICLSVYMYLKSIDEHDAMVKWTYGKLVNIIDQLNIFLFLQ